MSEFQSDPRSYAIGLVENGLCSADNMITACLKYMSHDEVRGMLSANELAPACCRIEAFIDQHDASEHDVEAIRIDIDNGNLECGDDTSEYEHSQIVYRSFENGQFSQAKAQCERFKMDYNEALAEFKE